MEKIYTPHAIRIQSWFRGGRVRQGRLPLILYQIQYYLKRAAFRFSTQTSDGRTNSSIDEAEIIQLLTGRFGDAIRIPKARMWYDLLARDSMYGWLPVNIKTTTTKTSDNTGNLAMCVYAYTDELLDIHREKSYESGPMSEVLVRKLKEKKYNRILKKDYYFIVLNKTDPEDIIVNSVKGLSTLTPNINNLPFQVCWEKNRQFEYAPIQTRVRQLIECLQRPKPSWKEVFMENIRSIPV